MLVIKIARFVIRAAINSATKSATKSAAKAHAKRDALYVKHGERTKQYEARIKAAKERVQRERDAQNEARSFIMNKRYELLQEAKAAESAAEKLKALSL